MATINEDRPTLESVAAAERALELLTAFCTGDETLPLAELADRTGLVKSTIMRLAISLERCVWTFSSLLSDRWIRRVRHSCRACSRKGRSQTGPAVVTDLYRRLDDAALPLLQAGLDLCRVLGAEADAIFRVPIAVAQTAAHG